MVHCKKSSRHSRPKPTFHFPNCLVCDILAGDRNVANLFLRCMVGDGIFEGLSVLPASYPGELVSVPAANVLKQPSSLKTQL